MHAHHPAPLVTLTAFVTGTATAEQPAARRPRPTPYKRHPEAAATGCQCRAPEPCWDHPADPVAELQAAAACTEAAGWAPTPCQCQAPRPCVFHPADRPLIARPPAWNEPHPDSPVARTRRRLAADRAAGVLPGAEPGQGIGVLPFLTDYELAAWTQALLEEHHRRQQQFLDYRRGAEQARGRTA